MPVIYSTVFLPPATTATVDRPRQRSPHHATNNVAPNESCFPKMKPDIGWARKNCRKGGFQSWPNSSPSVIASTAIHQRATPYSWPHEPPHEVKHDGPKRIARVSRKKSVKCLQRRTGAVRTSKETERDHQSDNRRGNQPSSSCWRHKFPDASHKTKRHRAETGSASSF